MSNQSVRNELVAQAMRWLARREYSVDELRKRLAGKGYPPSEVSATVAEFESQGLVSDPRFTDSLLRNRIERGYGPLRIAHDLRSKGIDETLIGDALPQDPEYWLICLRALWDKRFGKPPANYREWTRQARALQARGFTAEQVRHVIPGIDADP